MNVTVLDNSHGQGVAHECAGAGHWTPLGANAGGHEVFMCGAGAHILIREHRSAEHKCVSVQCLTVDTVTVTRVGKTPGRYRYRLAFSKLPGREFGPYGFGEATRDLTISALLEPIDARNLVLDAAASGVATRATG